MAQQVLAKISPCVLSRGTAVTNPSTLLLPELVRNNSKTYYTELSNLEKQCHLVVSDPSTHDIGNINIKEINAKVASAKKAETLMVQMMATLDKMIR